jgi:UDP-glucose 4-epimerase
MNVGTGRGGSVREVINLVCAATGLNDVVTIEAQRRAGDPAFLCANVSLIQKSLSFKSKYSLAGSAESLF